MGRGKKTGYNFAKIGDNTKVEVIILGN